MKNERTFFGQIRRTGLYWFAVLCAGVGCCSDAWADDGSPADTVEQVLTLMFYNVENFMDTADNPLTADDDFLPQSPRHWTATRLRAKQHNLSRVLMAAGGGTPPAIVGLAEVETDSLVGRWLRCAGLGAWRYAHVVTASPDRRGINVALLYQPALFRLLGWESVRVMMPATCRPTRDLLHAWGRLPGGDTLDVIVCHLPSRYGGVKESELPRQTAHRRLRELMDSVLCVRGRPRLVVMGDMNDYPTTRALSRHLRLHDPAQWPALSADREGWADSLMFNLMLPLQRSLRRDPHEIGSYKYQGEWGFLDQFFVNGRLLSDRPAEGEPPVVSEGPLVWTDHPRAFALPFMLTSDESYFGRRPLRTYYGFRYEGGFSDHLPVLIDLHVRYVPSR